MLRRQGAKSVEVRPVGISKGLAMSRIINSIAERVGHEAVQYDFVLVAGHFLARDENIFTFFEGQSLKVGTPIPDAIQPLSQLPGVWGRLETYKGNVLFLRQIRSHRPRSSWLE